MLSWAGGRNAALPFSPSLLTRHCHPTQRASKTGEPAALPAPPSVPPLGRQCTGWEAAGRPARPARGCQPSGWVVPAQGRVGFVHAAAFARPPPPAMPPPLDCPARAGRPHRGLHCPVQGLGGVAAATGLQACRPKLRRAPPPSFRREQYYFHKASCPLPPRSQVPPRSPPPKVSEFLGLP